MANKKIVPKEHQEEIIKLYVDKQYGIQKIIKILKEKNLCYGERIIKRILTENNIHIRNFNEAKVGCYKMEVPFELQQKIIDLYVNRNFGLSKIVEILQTNFSFDKVRSILEDNGIHIRNLQESAQVKVFPDLRKYQIDDNYNFQSHNGAWILGMFASDGYLPNTKGAKNRMVLTLQKRDEDCLELIKKELKYTGPINYYKSAMGYPNVSLAFTSCQIRMQMESFDIVNAKTFKLHHLPKKLKDCYMLDYLRGYFDGDGCVYGGKNKKSIEISLVSVNKSFLQQVKKYLAEKLNTKGGSISPDKNAFQLSYGKYDSLKIGSAFYDNQYLALPRKKNKFIALREQLPRA